MRSITYRCLLLFCASTLPSCAIKGYNGPELADDQVATVTLKSPVVSLVPIFWIFPFNMLTWLAGDWYETSQHFEIKVDEVDMNRFKTVTVRPGPLRITSKNSTVVKDKQIGSTECSHSKFEYKDKNNQNVYDETTSCATPHLVTLNIKMCQILLSVEADQHYEVFIRNTNLMLLNLNNQRIENAVCKDYNDSNKTNETSTRTDYDQHH